MTRGFQTHIVTGEHCEHSNGLRKKNSELKPNHYQCTMGIWAAKIEPYPIQIEVKIAPNQMTKPGPNRTLQMGLA